MRKTSAAAIAALALSLSGTSALAFSNEPAPDGPGVQSQFSDPDEAVENLANGAAGGGRTDLSTGEQIPAGAHAAQLKPPSPQDAEPVNPSWPAWMVWHQQ